MNKYLICFAISFLLITSCGRSPEKARQELNKIGIEFSDAAFNTAVKKKDKIAIDLFIDAEHDASFALASAVSAYAGEENKDIELLKKLIDNSSNLNMKHRGSLGLGNYSALGRAASSENETIVKLLLKKGADPSANNGEALREALLYKKNLEITKILVDADADIDAKDQSGSLLHSALIDKKLPEIKQDEDKSDPENKLDPVKFLLDNGANVNDGTDGNSNSLIAAISIDDLELIELLLKKGANVNSTWQDPNSVSLLWGGRTPKKYTLYEIAEGKPEILAILDKYSKKQNQ